MDFFTELLESFSRKHDRKLRLLEQDEQRVAQAEKAIKSVVAATPPQKGAAVTVGNAKVAHTGTVAGAYNFATYDFKTGKLSPKGKSDFGRVVSAVLGEGDKGEEERKKKKEEAEAALPVITPAIDKALLDIGIDVKADPAILL
jgi:hypothetical protein